jgi:hypothetical protein
VRLWGWYRANFILSPSLKHRSILLYLAASEVVEDEDYLVEWIMGWMVFSNDLNQANGLIKLISQMVVVAGAMGQCCVPLIQFVWPSQSCLQGGGCA